TTVRFSSTLSDGKTSRSCGTQPMPPWARRWLGALLMLLPANQIQPSCCRATPISVVSKVVLPLPLRPNSTMLPPAARDSDTSSRMMASPWPAHTFSKRSNSGMGSFSQIHFLDLGVMSNDVGRILDQQRTGNQYRNAFGKAEHQIHIVLDQNNGDL